MYCKFESFNYMNTKQIHIECIDDDGYLLCMIPAYYDVTENYTFNLHLMDKNCERSFYYLLDNKLAELIKTDKIVKIVSEDAIIYHMKLTPMALLHVL